MPDRNPEFARLVIIEVCEPRRVSLGLQGHPTRDTKRCRRVADQPQRILEDDTTLDGFVTGTQAADTARRVKSRMAHSSFLSGWDHLARRGAICSAIFPAPSRAVTFPAHTGASSVENTFSAWGTVVSASR